MGHNTIRGIEDAIFNPFFNVLSIILIILELAFNLASVAGMVGMLVGFVLPIILSAFGQSGDNVGENPITYNVPVMDFFKDKIDEITPDEQKGIIFGFISALIALYMRIIEKTKLTSTALLIAIIGLIFTIWAAGSIDPFLAAIINLVSIFASIAALISITFDIKEGKIGPFITPIGIAISICCLYLGAKGFYTSLIKACEMAS